jgi:hypothetical protein
MARYTNGTIRPSQAESVSDSLRAVRTGYLLDGGTPVTGNYMDAISDQLRAGFGPPPTPSVGYAATAEYVYPSQKMVTGAALAGQMLRESLKTSYSSPASDYHSTLRGLRGLGATVDAGGCKATVQAGDGPYQVQQALKAVGITMTLDQVRAVITRNNVISVGTYDIPAQFCGTATSGGSGSTGTTAPPVKGLPKGVNDAIEANFKSGKISRERADEQKLTVLSEEAETLAAYNKSSRQQQLAYETCIADESDDAYVLGFSGFGPANCRDRVGVALAPSGWDQFVQSLKDIGSGVVAVTGEGVKFTIDAGIQKLQSAGAGVPSACSPNKYTAGCAGAVAAALSALDKSQQTLPGGSTGNGGYVPPSSSGSDNTGLFIGLGVAAVAVIGILAVVMSKKQSASAA